MRNIHDQYLEVASKVCQAAQSMGREVQLVTVSKTFPVEDLMQAYAAGARVFGENRLQEAELKAPQMPDDCQWHLIGPLQRNKVRKALQLGVSMIEAVDSLRLAEAISRIAGELGLCPDVLLEVNVDGEASKHGFSPDLIRDEWEALCRLPHLRIAGLMCIPTFTHDPQAARPAFVRLRELAEELRARGPLSLSELSMGMSHDYEVAIDEGATLVRVGSAIFGHR